MSAIFCLSYQPVPVALLFAPRSLLFVNLTSIKFGALGLHQSNGNFHSAFQTILSLLHISGSVNSC